MDSDNGGEGDDLILGGQGSDELDWPDGQYATPSGGPGDDVIRGGPANDHFQGGQWGLEGDGGDRLYGGTGQDALFDNAYHGYCDANDLLFGGSGGDDLYTTGGDDYAYGGSGDDDLGRTGYDAATRGEELAKDTGDDTYDGGPGRDIVTANHASTSSVFVDLSAGHASSDSLGEDVLLNLVNVVGSPQEDTIIGDDGPNWLMGGFSRARRGTIDWLDGAEMMSLMSETVTAATGSTRSMAGRAMTVAQRTPMMKSPPASTPDRITNSRQPFARA